MHHSVSSSNHGTLSEGNPVAEVKKGYANVGPQPSVEIEQELEAVGGEATPSYALVDKSKKKGKKKDKKAAEQKQTEDQYAVVDKSKKKKKKNEPDATYAEVDMSKKSKKVFSASDCLLSCHLFNYLGSLFLSVLFCWFAGTLTLCPFFRLTSSSLLFK